MKKLLAVLSAGGLMVGIAGVLGATAATAAPARAHQPYAVSVSQTTNLSKTLHTTLTVIATGATAGDLLEAGICNDDASIQSPLVKPTNACTAPQIDPAGAGGTFTFTITLKPGKQGKSTLSGCPQSKQQYGLGIQCIVASEDISTGATADIPLYFKAAAGKASGTAFHGVFTVSGGFAVAGLYGSTPGTLATGCQSFSKTATASWTGIPLCDDGANAPAGVGGPFAAGVGLAAGEGVEVTVNGTPVGSTQAVGDQGGADVSNPGGAVFDFTFAKKGNYKIQMIGVGDGTNDGTASGVVNKFTAIVSAAGNIT